MPQLNSWWPEVSIIHRLVPQIAWPSAFRIIAAQENSSHFPYLLNTCFVPHTNPDPE